MAYTLWKCFSPFSIAITPLVEERANLSAFRTFVRFVLVWICWSPLTLGVWEGLRFVIEALPGLFSYLFLMNISVCGNYLTHCVWSSYFVTECSPSAYVENCGHGKKNAVNCLSMHFKDLHVHNIELYMNLSNRNIMRANIIRVSGKI